MRRSKVSMDLEDLVRAVPQAVTRAPDDDQGAIGTASGSAGLRVRRVEVSEFCAVGVDFRDDLDRANRVI